MSKGNPRNQKLEKQYAKLYEDISKGQIFIVRKKISFFFLYTKAANVCPTEPSAIR
jgi:hypothetical protein